MSTTRPSWLWCFHVLCSSFCFGFAVLGAAGAGAQDVVIDFDATGPTMTDDIPASFDLLGKPESKCAGPGECWRIDPNTQNAANGTNALHITSDGGFATDYFSRVAILKASIFEGRDIEYSADLTFDDQGGDANDSAGIYFRFNGSSDDPHGNEYYFVRLDADSPGGTGNSNVFIHRVKNGSHAQLIGSANNNPIRVKEGDTVTVTVRAVGREITVLLNGQPVANMNPFIDPDPLLDSGLVGVGENTNPAYWDNLVASTTDRGILFEGDFWDRFCTLQGAPAPAIVNTSDGRKSFYMTRPSGNKFGIYVLDVTQLPAPDPVTGIQRFPVHIESRQVQDFTNGLAIRNLSIDPDDPTADPAIQVQTAFVSILFNDTGVDGGPPLARDDRWAGEADTADIPGQDPRDAVGDRIGRSGPRVEDPVLSTATNATGTLKTTNATLPLRQGINILRFDPTDPRDLPRYDPDTGFQIFRLTIGPEEAGLKARVILPCDVRRRLSRNTYFPGDTVAVTLTARNLLNEVTITERVPPELTIVDPGAGVVDAAAGTIAFTAAADGEFTYTVMTPVDCKNLTISGAAAGTPFPGRPIPDSTLGCGIQPSGGISGMLQIGPINPVLGAFPNVGANCDDNGRLGATDYLNDGLVNETNALLALGDELMPLVQAAAGFLSVNNSPNAAINPRRGEGILTVWFADADSQGRINFNDGDNAGDANQIVHYSLVYLVNNTGSCRDAVLEVGSDDGAKVIFNGKVARVVALCRGVPGYGGGDRVPVSLAVGTNVVLIATVEAGGGHDVRLVLRNPDDSPLADGSVTATFTPPAAYPVSPSAQVTRVIPTDIFRPGASVPVTLEAKTVGAGTSITETLPLGWGVADAGGGMVMGPPMAVLDFDTAGPAADADLANFFDFLGKPESKCAGPAECWRVEPNLQNAANGTKALHITSDGGFATDYFSRAAILKASVFEARNLEYSVDLTFDDAAGDANDSAGIYFRFNGSSDDPLGNEYYFVRVDAANADGTGNSAVFLHRVKNGAHSQVVQAPNDDPIKVKEGDTVKVTVIAEGAEITVLLNGLPVSSMNPFIDSDPILNAGRVGVGENTNPTYYDNFAAAEIGQLSIRFALNADQNIAYRITAPDAGPELARIDGVVTAAGAEGCNTVGGSAGIRFFQCPAPAGDAELVAAFAFGSRPLVCPTFNDPTVNYEIVLHSSGTLPAPGAPGDLRYREARGYGYVAYLPPHDPVESPNPYGARGGYSIFGPFDDSPNGRGEFPGSACPEELYDSFIGAKDFLTPCDATITGGDPSAPCANDVEGIIFRVDSIPKGLYRFVGAFSDPDNPHAHRILVENGGAGGPSTIGEHVALVDNYDQAQQSIGQTDRVCEGVFARVGFDGRVPPLGDGSLPDPQFIDFDENGLPTVGCPSSPILAVDQGYIRLHQLQGNSNNGPVCGQDRNGGDAVILEIWRIGSIPCPAAGDTHVAGLTSSGPEGNFPGDYIFTATAADDGGDPIRYTFTADDGSGGDPERTAGPQPGASATFSLSEGTWRVCVRVDDDPDCPDEAADVQRCIDVTVNPPGRRRLANDCNKDKTVDISDAVCLLSHLFLGDPLDVDCGEESILNPAVIALLDANGDADAGGGVDISDPVALLGHLFLGTPAPVNGGIDECKLFIGCEDDACP